jgi:phosphoglycerol transferase MdoB-like AlkP superfamily enzyme
MLEAYNDFSRFPGIELELSPYEHMHALQKDGYSGLLYTNIFAGNTIVTERSFLTGFGSYEYKKNTASFVRYLKNQGYYTEAMHSGYGWFYDRKNVFN